MLFEAGRIKNKNISLLFSNFGTQKLLIFSLPFVIQKSDLYECLD